MATKFNVGDKIVIPDIGGDLHGATVHAFDETGERALVQFDYAKKDERQWMAVKPSWSLVDRSLQRPVETWKARISRRMLLNPWQIAKWGVVAYVTVKFNLVAHAAMLAKSLLAIAGN